MILGVCLFTLGALFQLGLWSSVLLISGGFLFGNSFWEKYNENK